MKEYEIRVVNMMIINRIEYIRERLSHANINQHNNINQHANNNLYTIQTKIYYTQQVLAYKYN